MSALVVEALEVRYGALRAVRGLSFEVGRGEIVGLIGPNGAGKSSTLHAIMELRPSWAARSRWTDAPSPAGGRRTLRVQAWRSCRRDADLRRR